MDSMSYIASFAKMLAVLSVVLALILGSLWAVKKLRRRSGMMDQDENIIEIVAVKHLSHRDRIFLVDVLGELILIGLAGGRMTRLSAISDPSAKEKMKSLPKKQAAFPFFLEKLLKDRLRSSEGSPLPSKEMPQENMQ